MQCVVRPPPGSQGKKAAQPTTKAARRTGRVVGATETDIRTPAPLQPPSFMPPCIGKRLTACDARRATHRVCAAASHRSARPLPTAPLRGARRAPALTRAKRKNALAAGSPGFRK